MPAKPVVKAPKTPKQIAAGKAAALRRDPDGVHRAAKARTCRHCHQPTFTGLDNDMCAYTATVDPAPLSAAGEVLALMFGRRTYTFTWYPSRGRYEIDLRDQWSIESKPPGANPNTDVVSEHVCDSPGLPRLSTMMRRQNGPLIFPAEPPF